MVGCKGNAAKSVCDDFETTPRTEAVSQSVADADSTMGEEKPKTCRPPIAPQITYPSTLRHTVLVIALLLAQFLVALDMVSATLIDQPSSYRVNVDTL